MEEEHRRGRGYGTDWVVGGREAGVREGKGTGVDWLDLLTEEGGAWWRFEGEDACSSVREGVEVTTAVVVMLPNNNTSLNCSL